MTAPEDLVRQLDAAIAASTTLGLAAADATAVREDAVQRGGYPGDLYVLALAGGTGVGKSSLLNALAGSVVSVAGSRRPTTTGAVAWVPAGHEEAAGPLLDWLGGADIVVREARGQDAGADDSVAVLDLPDLDSVEPGHAARVDAVLPRVDAVAWVSDPEKYADAVLHDRYLRRWTPRLDRQAFVLNKTDRVSPADAAVLRADIRARLAALGDGDMPILLTSAQHDPQELRSWLADGVEAREVIRRRLRRATDAAIGELVRAAGMDPEVEPGPLVSTERRDQARAATTDAVLRVVDIEGLRAQAAAATLDAARGTGGGVLGRIRMLLDRGSGRRERVADPQGHLIRWHDRGSLVPATLPLRQLLGEALADLPPSARGGVAGMADGDALARRLADATDRALAGPAGRFSVPRGRLWPFVGVGQVLATAALVAGVVWLVAAFLTGSTLPAGTFDVPLIGPMPVPAVLILVGLFGSWLLSRVLAWDARRLGRAWADRLADDVRARVDQAVTDAVSAPLRDWDDARARLWRAARPDPPG
ncbi:MAG: GTPase [Candidatus Limnocylindrales bacterium]